MNESGYTQSFNRALRGRGVYAWKISDRFTNGIPDCWYSAARDLWVEWKYLKQFPVRAPVRPDLSKLQQQWLIERHEEGRQVAVIVASPTGCLIYPGVSWQTPLPARHAITKTQAIDWVLERVSDVPHHHAIQPDPADRPGGTVQKHEPSCSA